MKARCECCGDEAVDEDSYLISNGMCGPCFAEEWVRPYESESGVGWKADSLKWKSVEMPMIDLLMEVAAGGQADCLVEESRMMSPREALDYFNITSDCGPLVVVRDQSGLMVEVWDGWHRMAAHLKLRQWTAVVRVIVGEQF